MTYNEISFLFKFNRKLNSYMGILDRISYLCEKLNYEFITDKR